MTELKKLDQIDQDGESWSDEEIWEEIGGTPAIAMTMSAEAKQRLVNEARKVGRYKPNKALEGSRDD